MKKNNLDEMQEQKLLKIEHNACWLSWTCLLIAIFVQPLLGANFFDILGETLVLLVNCIYLTCACLKNGIWDRRLSANWKTNLVMSLVAGVGICIFSYFYFSRRTSNMEALFYLCLIGSLITFAICFGALTLCTSLYKKRRKKLDQE